MNPIEVIHFPKLCPKCKLPLTIVKKFSGVWWYECNRCPEERP